MQFTTKKRRQPPAVIIISLIDILIVLLIFLMLTTTFRQRPAINISLPESKQAKPGDSDSSLVVTVAREQPFFYFKAAPVTLEALERQIAAEAANRSDISVVIDADRGATVENVIKAMDAAKAAKVQKVTLSTKAAADAR